MSPNRATEHDASYAASVLSEALCLAREGHRVFPLVPYAGDGRTNDGKTPAVAWKKEATSDSEKLREWFGTGGRYEGYGLAMRCGTEHTNAAGEIEQLVAVDIDKKNDKDGEATLKAACEVNDLELKNFATRLQSTPNGGTHALYWTRTQLKQGANVLGPNSGVDTRTGIGYIAVAPTRINGRAYEWVNPSAPIASMGALENLFPKEGARTSQRKDDDALPLPNANPESAERRSIDYLTNMAPPAIEGNSGDETTYKVANRLKDFGCSQLQTFDLMLAHWNDRCTPPWNFEELQEKVANAFKYGQEKPGSAAPENAFPDSPVSTELDPGHPLEKLNQEYAFIQAGGYILQETTDSRGRSKLERHSIADFNNWYRNKPKIQFGDGKPETQSEAWMKWVGRREYKCLVFAPGKDFDASCYNLWHGFTVEPAATGDHPTVRRFLDHALKNVCNGDKALFHWLIGYFAHMVQRPWEKPLVALVFWGKKGVGKNALIERIKYLLGRHALVTAKRRYLTSNFNGHFENCLLFVADEMVWPGDKQGEGELKDLITGTEHVIEHKGQAPFVVDNLTRVVIIGNEKWLVPATADERRFAVFEVGNGRLQDRKYFEEMRVGLEERGGAAYLLRYLLDFDLTGIDVNAAPNTRGLANQRCESLVGVDLFWYECARSATVADDKPWSQEGARLHRRPIYQAYERLHKGNRFKYPHESEVAFWEKTCDLFGIPNKQMRIDGQRAVNMIGLAEARPHLIRQLGVPDVWQTEIESESETPNVSTAPELFDQNYIFN
jgi:hypothetical protein